MVGCMVVMPRERWTDEKLDKAFGRIDGDLRELRVEMRKGFEKIDQRFEQIDRQFELVDKRFEQVDKRFERFEDKIDGLQQNMTTWFIGLSFAIIGSLVAALFLG
jgi:archaellum component FlaC